MTLSCSVDESTAAEWSELARQFSDYSIYQTWAYGEITAQESHCDVSRIVIRRGEGVIGAAQLRVKRLPFLRAGVAYAYFGPLWQKRGSTAEDLRLILEKIQCEYGRRRKLEVRIVPNRSGANGEMDAAHALAAAGFKRDHQAPAYRTFLVDLGPPEETLRKALAQKWRNGLNQAEKKGVRTQWRTDGNAMSLFEPLYDTMWARKQFESGVCVSSFCRLQNRLGPREKLSVLLAYCEDELVAGHVSSTLGDTCIYLLGASTDRGRECKASYLLQWQAMVGAKTAGARWYDLGGIDPDKNPGVYHFKAGLGGIDKVYAGRFRATAGGAGRFVVPWAERMYRMCGLPRGPGTHAKGNGVHLPLRFSS